MTLPISLTSISSRLTILPRTLRCLLDQTLKPSAIHVYLSREPSRITTMDSGCSADLPEELQSMFATEPLLHLHWTENLGPHTKLIPFCQEFPNTPVLVVDDDTLHESTLVETAFYLWCEHKCCISFRATLFNKDEEYRLWPNAAGKRDVLVFHKGNGGVVYHTSWFQDPAFNNPEIFKKIAETADDVWFNAWRIKQGISCYCYVRCLLKYSIPVKSTLFHINESKNDETIRDVWRYLLPSV